MPFVNTNREGTQFAFPDVCTTPTQTETVPVPYPNQGMLSASPADASKTKIRIGRLPAQMPSMPKARGEDTGGSGRGIASGTMMGSSRFARGGYKVKMEGASSLSSAPQVNAPSTGVCANPECRFHEHAIPETRLATLPVAIKVAFADRVVCLECYKKLVGDMPKPAPFTQDTSTESLTGMLLAPSQVKVTIN